MFCVYEGLGFYPDGSDVKPFLGRVEGFGAWGSARFWGTILECFVWTCLQGTTMKHKSIPFLFGYLKAQ